MRGDLPCPDAPEAYAAADKHCGETLSDAGLAVLKAEYAAQTRVELRRAFVAGWYAHERAAEKRAALKPPRAGGPGLGIAELLTGDADPTSAAPTKP